MLTGVYTVFTHIPVYPDDSGALYTDPLWAKDLALHLDYIEDLRMCCPLRPMSEAPADVVKVPGITADKIFDIPTDHGWASVFRNLIPKFFAVKRAVAASDILHSGGAGWPFPICFYFLPLRPFYRYQSIVIMESSFWMKPEGRRATLRQLFAHYAHKWLLGISIRQADARIYTQDGYRRFFNADMRNTLIAPAVWVDAEQILSDDAQHARLAALPDDDIRFLFAARLVPDKGSDDVLAAVEEAEKYAASQPLAEGRRISIDIIGSGELADRCRAFANTHTGTIKLRFLDPVEYGEPFFSLLRQYHALLIANRQEEQPRIVFDAFSQGVPVVSSDTTGVRDIVQPGENALLFRKGDPKALAQEIRRFANDTALRAHLTSNSLPSVRGMSHEGMHKTRAVFLKEALGQHG